jgi:cell division septation protein DedD
MLGNAVYFGWMLMQETPSQTRVTVTTTAQTGKKILLLSEKPSLQIQPPQQTPTESSAPVATALSSPQAKTADGPQCFNMGPFASDGDLQNMLDLMRSKHFLGRVDKRKVDDKDYWVFVPAYTNRDHAEAKLRELKSKNIDGFVVREGVFANAISLNHFSRKDLAQVFLQKMQAVGETVEYREAIQPHVERWIYLASNHAKANLKDAIEAQLVKKDSLKRENVPCEE